MPSDVFNTMKYCVIWSFFSLMEEAWLCQLKYGHAFGDVYRYLIPLVDKGKPPTTYPIENSSISKINVEKAGISPSRFVP